MIKCWRQRLCDPDESIPLLHDTRCPMSGPFFVNPGWEPLTPVECDLCSEVAVWEHPTGGFRCGNCPRPENTGI